MKIETPRLILRKPKESDWKDLVEGLSNLDVTKNLLVVPHPYTKKDALKFIRKTQEKWRKKKKETYKFVIELKSEKKVIGGTDISIENKEVGSGKSGSWLNKKYWRKGYITEAKIPLIDFAFNELKLKRLQTSAFSDNKASNKMSRSLGYRFVGTLKKSEKCKANGKIKDENLYELLKEDWPKNRKRLKRKIKGKNKT